MTATELRSLMERADIVTPCHDWRDASEIVDATGRGIAGADDKDRDYLIAAINTMPALLDLADAAARYRQTIRDGELATGRKQRHDAEALDEALARLEKTK